MNDSRPPLFVPALFAKVFTIVLAVAVAGVAAAIWLQGTIAARDVAGALICSVIAAYWLHLLVVSHKGAPAKRE